ncbi:MAG TPA: V-type ATP synthase subunit K [Kiritimatiellia bacterium]|nr:V-type ATP synthase subunit K [Kiritimatiellia bacterium]HMP00157.1 V-type ATP synthase subunit K [Kiritimatiellia bacterium]HMP96911.1 V-type ATP synthase subunit K [Kiritimatiellia bacterium]
MEPEVMIGFGKFGAAAAMACAAMGSALGTGAAGSSVIGVWKKCFAQSKAAPFILMTFVGAPLSQTIYGMILMNNILTAIGENPALYPAMISAGIFGGIAMALSAWAQGRAGAGAADALAETGKGFGNYLMVLGVIETVALFVMVFVSGAIK